MHEYLGLESQFYEFSFETNAGYQSAWRACTCRSKRDVYPHRPHVLADDRSEILSIPGLSVLSEGSV